MFVVLQLSHVILLLLHNPRGVANEQAVTLTLRETTPDTETLIVSEGIFEALLTDIA
jgi:hypothetical protein